jgi:catechol 2,3-dioxygenase-like lactoylglutathione lyase family enzyme
MQFHRPLAQTDPNMARLDKLGFNHICPEVVDADATVEHLKANGVEVRGCLDGFYDRRVLFVTGPEGITIERSQST